MPKELFLASPDACRAHALGVVWDAAPRSCEPHESPLEAAYSRLLKAYEHMEAECTQTHRDLRRMQEDRERARWQRNGACGLVVFSLAAWALAFWAFSRICR